MSSKNNKFGFAPVEENSALPRRTRAPGPMGAAVRDTAESITEATEAKVEQRRKNAEDAKAFRAASEEGLVLQRLPVGNLRTDAMPRDRIDLDAVASSEEMEELKASIRERGQKEPIEVFIDDSGGYQLKKGWRRLSALRQLHSETGEAKYGTVVARVEAKAASHISRYIDMVEENVIREDLTFAEMASVAIEAARDDAVDEVNPMELVNRLYGALHKTKRSYIRAFVFLLTQLEDSLKWPKSVSRNLGVDVSRALRDAGHVAALRTRLEDCGSPEAQGRVLDDYLRRARKAEVSNAPTEPKQKFEFRLDSMKITARDGECRIVSDQNFAMIQKDRLEQAVRAFQEALTGPPTK